MQQSYDIGWQPASHGGENKWYGSNLGLLKEGFMLKLKLVAFTAVHPQWTVGVFWFYFLGSLHVVHPYLLSVFPTNADTSP